MFGTLTCFKIQTLKYFVTRPYLGYNIVSSSSNHTSSSCSSCQGNNRGCIKAEVLMAAIVVAVVLVIVAIAVEVAAGLVLATDAIGTVVGVEEVLK